METSICGSGSDFWTTRKVAFAAATGIVGVFIAFSCFADTQYLPVGVTTNLDVAADATLSDTISLADRTAVVKGGAG